MVRPLSLTVLQCDVSLWFDMFCRVLVVDSVHLDEVKSRNLSIAGVESFPLILGPGPGNW